MGYITHNTQVQYSMSSCSMWYQINCKVSLVKVHIIFSPLVSHAFLYRIKMYRKDPKFWDAINFCCKLPKIQTKRSNQGVIPLNNADGIANSEDTDQTASLGAVWSGSALFAQTYLSENLGSIWYIKTWAASWENHKQSAYAKTKTQISFAVTAKLISAFVFATLIVQYLYFLITKFQTCSYFQ